MAIRSAYVAFLLRKENDSEFAKWLRSNDLVYERNNIGIYEDKMTLITVELPVPGQKIITEVIKRKIFELDGKKSEECDNEESQKKDHGMQGG